MMPACSVFRYHEHNLGAGQANGNQIPWSDCTFSAAAFAGYLKQGLRMSTF